MDAPKCIVYGVLALVAAMSATHARGEPAQDVSRTSLGPLNFSCGKWTNTPKRSAEHEVLKTWLLGFVSGMNFENAGGDFLRDRDIDGITAWIDNYCRRNPLHAMTQAIYALTNELRGR
jgi:hypothetical protein